MKSLLIVAAGTLILGCSSGAQPKVRLGADVLVENRLEILKGKRVGLITNHTGRLSDGRSLIDVLAERGVGITAIFAPEHGYSGQRPPGEPIGDTRDSIRIRSLYGLVRKPTRDMLSDVDLLVYNIQDVGVRFYTYISTMGLAMQAAAENGKPFVVLDRPNPLGGIRVEGPVLDDSLKSFVGMYPIPVVYGLTCGELALMINGEEWLSGGRKTELTVIPMEGWTRSMTWDDTGLPWLAPSPNIPNAATTFVYPATCFIEATNLSEGRGTDRPFRYVGAPFVDGQRLADSLTALKLPGVSFSLVSFVPASSKHMDARCNGVAIEVTDQHTFQSVTTGLQILRLFLRSYPSEIRLNEGTLRRLLGSSRVAYHLMQGYPLRDISASWQSEVNEFKRIAAGYCLYR